MELNPCRFFLTWCGIKMKHPSQWKSQGNVGMNIRLFGFTTNLERLTSTLLLLSLFRRRMCNWSYYSTQKKVLLGATTAATKFRFWGFRIGGAISSRTRKAFPFILLALCWEPPGVQGFRCYSTQHMAPYYQDLTLIIAFGKYFSFRQHFPGYRTRRWNEEKETESPQQEGNYVPLHVNKENKKEFMSWYNYTTKRKFHMVETWTRAPMFG